MVGDDRKPSSIHIIENAPVLSGPNAGKRGHDTASAVAGFSPRGGWPAVRASSLQDVPVPPRQWCLPDWVPDKVCTLLSGDGGTGKSLLAMQLATCCALGVPFMGIEIARRKVLYVAAEDDLDELHRRQVDINAGLGVDFSELDDQLWWRALSDEEALLATIDGKGRGLKPTPTYDNLKRCCVENGIQLLIVDTVADTFGGVEFDRQHVTRYVRLLAGIARATAGASILVAHPSVSGLSSGSGISGSTAWKNAVRSVMYMRRPNVEDDGVSEGDAPDLRIVARLKSNFAPTGAKLSLSYWQGSFGLVDKPLDASPAIDVITSQVRVMTAIRRAVRQGELLSMSKNSQNYAPKILKPFKEVAGLKAQHLEDAIRALLEQEKLRHVMVGRPGHAKRCIEPADGQ